MKVLTALLRKFCRHLKRVSILSSLTKGTQTLLSFMVQFIWHLIRCTSTSEKKKAVHDIKKKKNNIQESTNSPTVAFYIKHFMMLFFLVAPQSLSKKNIYFLILKKSLQMVCGKGESDVTRTSVCRRVSVSIAEMKSTTAEETSSLHAQKSKTCNRRSVKHSCQLLRYTRPIHTLIHTFNKHT